jgi:peptidoglycan/xylan/chitin deacetylase (PgdA/CDA1 family)
VQARGFTIASHTWSHRRLDLTDAQTAEQELQRAWDALDEEELGADMKEIVAFPYGYPPTPLVSGVGFGFGTGRQEPACWHCRPNVITREYLDQADEQHWGSTIERWVDEGTRACDQCDHSNRWQVGVDFGGPV